MKTFTKFPFMSVVLCVWNGERDLGRAIESLLAQDYPRDRYEIIIVEDGSADRSWAVAKKYDVRIVRHKENRGISSARNTGLGVARGDVYVCFDHDCVVEPDWLRTLSTGYQLPGVLGVGSLVAHPKELRGIVDRYMAASGSGMPPSLLHGASTNPLARFLAYFSDQIHGGDVMTKPYPVRQLNGATASFPIDVLRAVGGWDQNMRWMEDTDMRGRLARAFPNRHFYAVPAARIVHDPKMNLKTFLLRPYIRGVDNMLFYTRQHITPPVFPFPIAWACATIITTMINPYLGIACAILAPQCLYLWWPMRGAVERNLWYFLFAYLQLGEELFSLAGSLRGFIVIHLRRLHAQNA
jgi:glycosyltransferase involved in cell wall biosynthesis